MRAAVIDLLLDCGFEAVHAAVVHVGRCELDVAKGRSAIFPDIGRAAGHVEASERRNVRVARYEHVALNLPPMATSNSPICGRVKLPHLSRRRDAAKLPG